MHLTRPSKTDITLRGIPLASSHKVAERNRSQAEIACFEIFVTVIHYQLHDRVRYVGLPGSSGMAYTRLSGRAHLNLLERQVSAKPMYVAESELSALTMPRHILHSDFRSDRRTAKRLKVQVLEIGDFAKIHPCEDATLRRMFCELLRMESEIRRFTPLLPN